MKYAIQALMLFLTTLLFPTLAWSAAGMTYEERIRDAELAGQSDNGTLSPSSAL
mgnify:CR=1 FL=1